MGWSAGIFHATISKVQRQRSVSSSSLGEIGETEWLLRAYGKGAVTCYIHNMQKSISECTLNTQWTLKAMDCSSRRPHWGSFLSAQNRKLMIQFAQSQQNWTVEDWKNVACSDDSWFLIQSDTDVGVRFDLNNIKAWIYHLRLRGSHSYILVMVDFNCLWAFQQREKILRHFVMSLLDMTLVLLPWVTTNKKFKYTNTKL